MSTFNPRPPVRQITVQDPYINNDHSVSDYLNDVKEKKCKREALLAKLKKHNLPDNVRKHLLGCPNESISLALKHLERCIKNKANSPSWVYLLDL